MNLSHHPEEEIRSTRAFVTQVTQGCCVKFAPWSTPFAVRLDGLGARLVDTHSCQHV